MAEVREVYSPRRRARIWPSVVMLLVVLLLIGIIVAMIMNIRGSVSWPAGRVEFGFRPNIFITKTEPVVSAPTRLAIDVAPAAEVAAPAADTAVEDAASRGDAVAPAAPAAGQTSEPAGEAPAGSTPPGDPAAPAQ